jgi:hypothetical protein
LIGDASDFWLEIPSIVLLTRKRVSVLVISSVLALAQKLYCELASGGDASKVARGIQNPELKPTLESQRWDSKYLNFSAPEIF